MSQPKLSRRTVLQGMGAAVALPMLEAMLPTSALAQSGRKSSAVRMLFISVPNGVHMRDWTPAAEGTNFELPFILQPLQNVRHSLNVLTGLTQDKARPNGDGAGDHARSAAAWLTGCQPRKTAGANIKAGVSADQLAAQMLGKTTRFPSLELGCERGGMAGNCDSGYSCAYSSSISWRSENTPMAKEVNPRNVFERLFGNGDQNESAENRHRRDTYRQSILDFVMEDAQKLNARLGTQDKRKLDEYLSSVREIELRLSRAEEFTKQFQQAGGKIPSGVPADYGDHVRLMFDMLFLAFQTDQTRISTFMYANEGSNRNYTSIGITDGHHDLSHHGNNVDKHSKLRRINQYQISHLAYFAEKLAATREGDKTMLDNSMIVYGSGISDGDMHNHDNLPVILLGKGGGSIRTGRHVRYGFNTPMNNLFLGMLDRMGIPAEKLGDSTGRLEQLI